jgi:hypothetical protein
MTDRLTVDTITSDQLDALYRRAEIADEVTAQTKTLLARRTETLRTRAERAEAERDGAYRERAHLLAWLAALHPRNAVLAPSLDIDDEDGWHLLFLTVAGRQMSWHIAPRDVELFTHVERVEFADPRAAWDGHTTDEKYERIRTLPFGEMRDAVRTPGPAEAAVERVRALHRKANHGDTCVYCAHGQRLGYDTTWPCDTIRALDEPKERDTARVEITVKPDPSHVTEAIRDIRRHGGPPRR